MASIPGCCAPTDPEIITDQASGINQLPHTALITTEGDGTLNATDQNTCCSGHVQCQEVPVLLDTNEPSCSDACYTAVRPLNSPSGSQAGSTCQDGCCPPKSSSVAKSTENKDKDDCGNACCASKEVEPDNHNRTFEHLHSLPEDTSSISHQAVDAQQSASQANCEDECCSKEQPASETSATVECCIGKTSPCCDKSCLDRLAVRECRQSTSCSGEQSPQLRFVVSEREVC